MNNRSLIYIGIPGSAVFESQVIELLKEIQKKNYFDRIVLLAGLKRHENNDKIKSELIETKIETVFFKVYPNYPFYSIIQTIELRKILKMTIKEDSILHIRGEFLSQFAFLSTRKIKHNIKIVTDVRGASMEETILYNRPKTFLYQLKRFQLKRNLKMLKTNSDAVSCVSESLKAYVINKTNIDKNKVFVNSCIAGNKFKFSQKKREEYRKKLNLQNSDVLFLFVTGGDKKWQNTEEIIKNIVKANVKVLNLSKRKIDIRNVINLFVPYEEVPNYLSAADIGIVWRNDDTVNNVASPVKFSEYVCSGLPIVANKGVHLIKNYVEETKYGKVVEDFQELEFDDIQGLIRIDRSKISDFASKRFSSELISDQYISLYNKLLYS